MPLNLDNLFNAISKIFNGEFTFWSSFALYLRNLPNFLASQYFTLSSNFLNHGLAHLQSGFWYLGIALEYWGLFDILLSFFFFLWLLQIHVSFLKFRYFSQFSFRNFILIFRGSHYKLTIFIIFKFCWVIFCNTKCFAHQI